MSPVVPVIAPKAKFQPVYVGDMAEAAVAALDASAAGRTFELGGPQGLTMAALQQWIANATGRKRLFVEVPDAVGAALARGLGWLPGAPITRDQWLMLQTDTVVTDDSDGFAQDRKRVAAGKGVAVRVDLGGRRILKK